MKRQKILRWSAALAALAVLLSLGAVACGSSEGEQVVAPAQERVAQKRPAEGAECRSAGNQGPLAERRDALREKREALQEKKGVVLERQKALLENLRDDMSEEDQAAYDELMATIGEQKSALEEARQELADTLKELKALAAKYLDMGDEAGEQTAEE